MKFQKYFEGQKVAEWTGAYIDYNGLKGILGEIMRYKQQSEQPAPPSRVVSLYRSFIGLSKVPRRLSTKEDVEDQVVDVNWSQHENSSPFYRTDFLRQSEEGGSIEANFFQKLDDELNKVNAFYKAKIEEVTNEADLLNKQMDALIVLRIKEQKSDPHVSQLETCGLSIANWANNLAKKRTWETQLLLIHAKWAASQQLDTGTGSEIKSKQQLEGSASISEDLVDSEFSPLSIASSSKTQKVTKCREDPLDIFENMKIKNICESPSSMRRGVLKDSKDAKLSFNAVELREVENRLRRVIIEFYQKLHILKHYSFMNLSAFAKILRKYEEITSRRVSRSYMKTVENSYIGNSDEMSALLESVEAIYIKHFANSNSKEGIKSFSPVTKKERHRITFLSGFFCGCSVALVAAVVLRIEARNLMEKREGALYMENVFPLYSFFCYTVLHMLLYAANLYFWRHYKTNYPFMFGFKMGTGLGYRHVVLLATGLAVLSLVGFLANLNLDLGGFRIPHYKTFTELVPLVVLMIVLFIILCPFDIIYRSSRFFLLRCIFRCICAPLFKVTMPDFLADNLTSRVSAFRCLELYICYYVLGDYSQRQKCQCHGAYGVFYFIVGIIPFWMRFLQCIRELCEDREPMHAYNCLKYFLTIVAVLMRTASELRTSKVWIVLGLVSSALAIIMNTYWDVVVDWGLLRRHSKNFCLRDKLLVPHKSVYFAALALNIVLRIAWMQLVLAFNLPTLHKMAASTIISCLEIIRRGIWNFFRLVSEQVNNVGNYRAFKSVPHPFGYYEDDSDDDDDGNDDNGDHPNKHE